MDLKKYFDVAEIKHQMQRCIAPDTSATLQAFCEQEPEFRQAIEQSGKSFQECLDATVKNAGPCLPDLEAYKRAVNFYFSTATIHFNMVIDLSGEVTNEATPITVSHSSEVKSEEPEQETSKSVMSLSLDDILDF